MFWKKGKEKIENSGEQIAKISVTTIPSEFYGGISPVIKFKTVEKSITSKPVVQVAPSVPEKSAAGLFSSKKFIFASAGAAFLVFILAGSFYYYQTMSKEKTLGLNKNDNQISQNQDNLNPVQNREPANNAPATGTPKEDPATQPENDISLSQNYIEFPSILLGRGEDLDNDGMTDEEEELFQIDPGKPDSDDDSYSDSTEIFYLYSPKDKAPMKIIDSSLVKEFFNPVFGYKVYYPLTWAVGNVDSEYRQMLFSTVTGENIELRVFDRGVNQSFEDWFASFAPDERINSLNEFETAFKEGGKARSDNLVYYFSDQEYFYVIVHHVTNSQTVNFGNVATMLARSFRSKNSAELMTEQKVVTPVQVDE